MQDTKPHNTNNKLEMIDKTVTLWDSIPVRNESESVIDTLAFVGP